MILGQFRSGPMFTLLDRYSPAQNAIWRCWLSPNQTCGKCDASGRAFEHPDAAAFDEIITSTGLNEWFGETPITSEMVPPPAPEAGHKITGVQTSSGIFTAVGTWLNADKRSRHWDSRPGVRQQAFTAGLP